MGKHDGSIGWLGQQIENARESLRDIAGGHRTWINDEEVTEIRKSFFEGLIDRYKRLIGAYERHND